jgi:hypothetical protein
MEARAASVEMILRMESQGDKGVGSSMQRRRRAVDGNSEEESCSRVRVKLGDAFVRVEN